MRDRTPASDVVIVGAGAIGIAIAWRCAQRGLAVTVVDPEPERDLRPSSPPRGAWHTAAGMLAPMTELHYTETPLLRLNLESLRRYPAFAEELTAEAKLSVGFRRCGAVAVAWDGADLRALHDLQLFAASLFVEAHLLTGAELRELEPALAPGLPGGLHAPGDHQIEPRLLHAALVAASRSRGVRFVQSSAAVLVDRERARGVRIANGGVVAAKNVVVAAGAWSGHIGGVPPWASVEVRPVKGQTLRLRLGGRPRLQRVLRATVKGSPVYVVPRPDGEYVVGASTEESGFDQQPRAGAVYELLRDAQSVLPELSEAVLAEVSTGLRPGSPDNAPIIGAAGIDGLVHASGHYRNGILLTPVTADGVADLLVDGTLPPVLAPFSPERFAKAAACESS